MITKRISRNAHSVQCTYSWVVCSKVCIFYARHMYFLFFYMKIQNQVRQKTTLNGLLLGGSFIFKLKTLVGVYRVLNHLKYITPCPDLRRGSRDKNPQLAEVLHEWWYSLTLHHQDLFPRRQRCFPVSSSATTGSTLPTTQG